MLEHLMEIIFFKDFFYFLFFPWSARLVSWGCCDVWFCSKRAKGRSEGREKSRKGSSVHYGVRFRPDLRKWVAEIRVAEWKDVDKKVWLGTFDTEEGAARGVDLARKLLRCAKRRPPNLACRELELYSARIPPHLDLTDLANDAMFKAVVAFIKAESRAYAARLPPPPPPRPPPPRSARQREAAPAGRRPSPAGPAGR
jgi:hypothetical protein